MRALGTTLLSTPDLLLPETDTWLLTGFDGVGGFQMCSGENVEPPKIVLIEVFDRVE